MKNTFIAIASTMLITGAFAQTPASVPEVPAVAPATADANVNAANKSDAKRDMNNEKHIKDLHAKLKITAAEESLWTNVASTMRDNTTAIDRAVDKRAAVIGKATALDDLSAYADIAQAHADSVKKLQIAFAPLYNAMPDAQKKLADEVFTQRGHNHMVASK